MQEDETEGRHMAGVTVDEFRQLLDELKCGHEFLHDLLILAGGDVELVREASRMCKGANSMKAHIINRRFRKIEER